MSTLIGPCSVVWQDMPQPERIAVTRARAAYLLRAARSRGGIAPAHRIARCHYRIGKALVLYTETR